MAELDDIPEEIWPPQRLFCKDLNPSLNIKTKTKNRKRKVNHKGKTKTI